MSSIEFLSFAVGLCSHSVNQAQLFFQIAVAGIERLNGTVEFIQQEITGIAPEATRLRDVINKISEVT